MSCGRIADRPRFGVVSVSVVDQRGRPLVSTLLVGGDRTALTISSDRVFVSFRLCLYQSTLGERVCLAFDCDWMCVEGLQRHERVPEPICRRITAQQSEAAMMLVFVRIASFAFYFSRSTYKPASIAIVHVWAYRKKSTLRFDGFGIGMLRKVDSHSFLPDQPPSLISIVHLFY